jgi:tripartite-type tricarboxylate transporter receptor subunit TctC
MMIRRFAVALLAVAGALAATAASAQTSYPTQTVKIVVAFPPGGATDVIGRLVAQGLSDKLGKSFVVDNRAGASGIVGSESVARSAPDGNTLLFVPSSHATLKALYPSLSYDPVKDFAPIALVATTPYLLVVHPSLGINDVGQLLAYARANPGKLNYASTGMGTAQHLAGELLKREAKVDILHVPYKGSGAVRGDLLSGRVQMMFDNVAVMSAYVNRGELRGLAVTTAKRTPLAPQVPTVAEAGLPGFEIDGWFGLLAPAGTSPEIVKTLNEAVNALLKDPDLAKRFAAVGAVPVGGTVRQLVDYMKAESDKWGGVIRDANIKAE